MLAQSSNGVLAHLVNSPPRHPGQDSLIDHIPLMSPPLQIRMAPKTQKATFSTACETDADLFVLVF